MAPHSRSWALPKLRPSAWSLFQGDGAAVRSCPAASVRVARHQRQRGASSCETSVERGQELQSCEWMSTVAFNILYLMCCSLPLFSFTALPFALWTGPRPVRGRPGAAETGLPVRRTGQSCRQGATGTFPVWFPLLVSSQPRRLTLSLWSQVIVDSMVALCRELCPLSAAAAERLSPPLSSISERVSIPRSSIRTALMERAAQDVHRALE